MLGTVFVYLMCYYFHIKILKKASTPSNCLEMICTFCSFLQFHCRTQDVSFFTVKSTLSV